MKGRIPGMLATIALVLIVGVALLLPSVVYVVDQRELAVVLQFGDPVAERTQPGVYFKLPFVQEVRRMPSTRQFWGDQPADELPDLPTKDDKKIEIIPWAVWRIKEPTTFVKRLRTEENAENRVYQFVRGAIRDVITQYDLAELVRSTDRELHTTSANLDALDGAGANTSGQTRKVRMRIEIGRQEILKKIRQEARRRLAAGADGEEGGRGIELVDLGISQIEFVESVREKTFDRWIAERQAISSRNVNEGERMKQEILNRTAADVQRIEGKGQQQANETRGQADADIIRRYAAAIEEVGEFYAFTRTLEAYEKAVGQDTRLILTTDSDFWKLMKSLGDEALTDEPSREAASTATERGGN